MGIQQWSEDIIMVDLANAEPELSEELRAVCDQLEAGADCHVVINMGDTSYINSSNIAQLLMIREGVGKANRELRLTGLNVGILDVMATTGLEKVFEIVDDLPMAIASLQLGE